MGVLSDSDQYISKIAKIEIKENYFILKNFHYTLNYQNNTFPLQNYDGKKQEVGESEVKFYIGFLI